MLAAIKSLCIDIVAKLTSQDNQNFLVRVEGLTLYRLFHLFHLCLCCFFARLIRLVLVKQHFWKEWIAFGNKYMYKDKLTAVLHHLCPRNSFASPLPEWLSGLVQMFVPKEIHVGMGEHFQPIEVSLKFKVILLSTDAHLKMKHVQCLKKSIEWKMLQAKNQKVPLRQKSTLMYRCQPVNSTHMKIRAVHHHTSSLAQINHIKVKGPLPKEVQLNATKPEQRQTAQIQVFMKETLLVRDSLMQP